MHNVTCPKDHPLAGQPIHKVRVTRTSTGHGVACHYVREVSPEAAIAQAREFHVVRHDYMFDDLTFRVD